MARRSGARSFTFDIDTGVGSLLPPKSQPVDFGAIQSAVKDAGFKLFWLEARVHGTLRAAASSSGTAHLTVEVKSPRQVFRIIEGTTAAERRGYGRLGEAATGRELQVSVRGRVHAYVDTPPGLTVLDFRVGR